MARDRELRRRAFLQLAAGAGIGAWSAACGKKSIAAMDDAAPSVFAEKARDLIVVTDRPPNLEMPLRYLRHDLTPNEAFFVRWHVSGIPTSIDLATFRLKVTGHVERPLALSLD